MEAITKYRAKDGREFDKEKECLIYEKLIDKVAQIMSQLVDREQFEVKSDFWNGEGYIQQDPSTFLKVKKEVLNLVNTMIDNDILKKAYNQYATNEVHPSWVFRILSDYHLTPLNQAWLRIQCTDNLYREWGQIFFANNPHIGTMNQLNGQEVSNG